MKFVLALFSLIAIFGAHVDAQAATELCDNGETCVYNFTQSCSELVANYTFTGSCCLMNPNPDNSGGCQVFTAGVDSTCNVEEDNQMHCTTQSDGSEGCVSGLYLTIMGNNTEDCPTDLSLTQSTPPNGTDNAPTGSPPTTVGSPEGGSSAAIPAAAVPILTAIFLISVLAY